MSRPLPFFPRLVTLGGPACLVAGLLLAACGEPNAPAAENQSALPAFAKGAPNPGSDVTYPTTLVIADSDNGVPLLVQSDAKGVYAPTKYITNKLVQWSTGQSTWQVALYYGARQTPTDRKMFFSLAEPVSASNPPPPFVQAYSTAYVVAKCYVNNVNLLALSVGGEALCPGSMRFQASDGKWYRLSFADGNYPEVDPMRLTCLSSDSLGCKSWQASTSGTTVTGSDPNPKGVQRLLEINSNGDVLNDQMGNYYISFNFVISR